MKHAEKKAVLCIFAVVIRPAKIIFGQVGFCFELSVTLVRRKFECYRKGEKLNPLVFIHRVDWHCESYSYC